MLWITKLLGKHTATRMRSIPTHRLNTSCAYHNSLVWVSELRCAGSRIELGCFKIGGFWVKIPNLINLLFQSLHYFVCIHREFLTDNLKDVLLIVIELLNRRVKSILLKFEFVALLAQNLIPNFLFQPEHRLLKKCQQTTLRVLLINQLISLFEKFGCNQIFHVFARCFNTPPHVINLAIFQVYHIQIMFFFLNEQV